MTIKGIRIEKLEVARTESGAGYTFSVDYSLMSDKDTVLAKQSCNGYNGDIKIEVSANGAQAIRALSDVIKKEIETVLGF